jgi:MucR family transcriptional regulator, transcriptional regulator of exopolysaccharide biosynthesis
MPDEPQSTILNRELATKIVAAYVRRNQIGADQIGTLISAVHQALAGAGKPVEQPEELTPAVPVRRSVQQDRVICLECGWAGKMLRRHIGGHGMSADEYRRRWSLSPDHSLVAPAYAEFRSDFAKQAGLGRRRGNGAAPKEAAAERPAGSPETKKPRSRGRGSRRRAKAEVQASAES